jgi:hypothetical protein
MINFSSKIHRTNCEKNGVFHKFGESALESMTQKLKSPANSKKPPGGGRRKSLCCKNNQRNNNQGYPYPVTSLVSGIKVGIFVLIEKLFKFCHTKTVARDFVLIQVLLFVALLLTPVSVRAADKVPVVNCSIFERIHNAIHPINARESVKRSLGKAAADSPKLAKVIDVAGSPAVLEPLSVLVEKAAGLGFWNKVIAKVQKDPTPNPFESFLNHFGTPVKVTKGEISAIPKVGPAVIYSLHPTGPLEALGATALALRQRSDVMLVGVENFREFKIFDPNLILVSVETQYTDLNLLKEKNLEARQKIKEHLAKGGALVIFPSGEPAIGKDGKLFEADFRPAAAKYAIENGATVVPLAMSNRLKPWVYNLGALQLPLQTRWAMQLRKEGQLNFEVGTPIEAKEYSLEDKTAVDKLNQRMRQVVEDMNPDYLKTNFEKEK